MQQTRRNPFLVQHQHLGLNTDDYDTSYFGESRQAFMINMRAENLATFSNELKEEGLELLGKV